MQIDESTDIANHSILLVYVRSVDLNDDILEEMECYLKLIDYTTAECIFTAMNEFF